MVQYYHTIHQLYFLIKINYNFHSVKSIIVLISIAFNNNFPPLVHQKIYF